MVRYVAKAIPLNCCNFIEWIWFTHIYTFSCSHNKALHAFNGRYQKKGDEEWNHRSNKMHDFEYANKEKRKKKRKKGRRILRRNKHPGIADYRCKYVRCEHCAHTQNRARDHSVVGAKCSTSLQSQMQCAFSENWKIYSLFNSLLRIICCLLFFSILYLSVVAVECLANTIQPAWNRSEYQFWSHRNSQMS